ncbi:hypothetical protein [Streptomyces sp. NPDC050416]|uniref:hypothetical protein n=1 Tax=Streptomyces sp. NPDC050416 TaxID=3365611 RepID=UPI00378A3ECD
MRGQFTGWPEQAMDVLWHLQGEPTHATRERYRTDRERLVRQPMIALLNEVADTDPRYEDFSVWHYRTDSWWWQHQSAVIRLGRKVEIGLRVSAHAAKRETLRQRSRPLFHPAELRTLGCGTWSHERSALRAMRHHHWHGVRLPS